MTQSLSDLSVEEIREQLVRESHISRHTLNRLKRDPRRGVQKLYEQLKRRYEKDRSERLRLSAMLNFENLLWKSGCRYIAGVDEVGVGPLAGPVVAAAVIFPPHTEICGIDDSKRLEPAVREELAGTIREKSLGIGLGLSEVGEIDELNIYHASLLAMRRAVAALPMHPDHLLVDARTIPEVKVPQNAFQKGDGLNFSIAAASIIAKTYRDHLMCELDTHYPGYGFAQHKGYATLEHQEAIRQLGPCLIHRMSFNFIREVCGEFSELFYSLKRCLEQSTDRAALRAFEQCVERERGCLGDKEQRKLRLLLTRRWKNLKT